MNRFHLNANARLILKTIGLVVIALLLLSAIWLVPIWRIEAVKKVASKPIAPAGVGSQALTSAEPSAVDYLQQEIALRAVLAQIVAGMLLAFGAWVSWRQFLNSREGQITDRFTKAISQLGSEQLEIRLGGIYALERIARDSLSDHWNVMEVLTTYVRENSPWPPRDSAAIAFSEYQPATGPELAAGRTEDGQAEAPPHRPKADIQAIMTVIGRRSASQRRHEQEHGYRLDLRWVDLRGADLYKAHLERAKLWKAHLEDASFEKAHLEDAFVEDAHLERAYFEGAQLERAHFGGAQLERARFGGANLDDADFEAAILKNVSIFGTSFKGTLLWRAVLHGAFLRGVNLKEAHLEAANLEGATLDTANLDGAHLWQTYLDGADLSDTERLTIDQLILVYYNDKTRFPSYIDRIELEKINIHQNAAQRMAKIDERGYLIMDIDDGNLIPVDSPATGAASADAPPEDAPDATP